MHSIREQNRNKYLLEKAKNNCKSKNQNCRFVKELGRWSIE